MSSFGFVSATATGDKIIVDVKDFISDAGEMIGGIISSILESMGFDTFSGKNATAQFLLMFITIMLVYSVMDFLGFFSTENDKGWINWMIAIAAGILGFLYIPVEMIETIADQYKFMAIALNIILPWGVVMAFIWRLQLKAFEGDGKINLETAKAISWIVGLSLIGYLFFKITSDPKFVGAVKWIAVIGIIIIIIFLIFISYVMRGYLKGKGKAIMSGFERRNRLELEKEAMHWADLIKDAQKRNEPKTSIAKLKKEFDKLAKPLGWDPYNI